MFTNKAVVFEALPCMFSANALKEGLNDAFGGVVNEG